MDNTYEPGNEITQNGETFTLVERLGTYPTAGQWALAKWKVHIKDRDGHYISESVNRELVRIDFFRPVREIGVPNTHNPDKIEGLDWEPPADDSVKNIVERATKFVSTIKHDGRGRPEGPMNDLKAYNTFRNIVKGTKEYDEAKVTEAADWIRAKGDVRFLEKYNKKFIEKGLSPLSNV